MHQRRKIDTYKQGKCAREREPRNEVLGKGVHWSTWLPLDPGGTE